MAKKTKNIELTLADAEKFFKRGNFPLAQREFETAQIILQRDDIAEKIKICEHKKRTLRAKDLIKKGNRAVSKNDLKTALANFKEALTLQDEPESWLQEKIKTFENEHSAGCADADASKAEKEGNFIEAASLYALAAEKLNDRYLVLKSASCLVRAGDYAEAVRRFSRLTEKEQSLKNKATHIKEETNFKEYGEKFLYDYGFALAKTGCFIKSLIIWNLLSDKNQPFLQQKKDVFALALSEIYKSTTLLAHQEGHDNISNLFEQADALYLLSLSLGTDYQQQFLTKICLYLKYEMIEDSWNKGDYKTVFNLLENMDTDADPLILSLKARSAFHLSANDPAYLKTMVNYWLTVIYSIDISTIFSLNPVQNEKIRNKIIKMAESVINSHINTPEGAMAAKQLNLETKLISDMLGIVRKSGAKQSEYAKLICTPIYAALAGIADNVLKLIISNKDIFDNTEHYLETGGYYCKVWESLYLMKTGDVKKAAVHLDSLSKESFDDSFSQYVRQIVNFEYGKVAIARGQKEFLKYFEETHLLFKTSPAIEKGFTDFIHELDELELLQKYEQVIRQLYERTPSEILARLYSFVMVESGTFRANRGILPDLSMKHVAKKALELDPDNTSAYEILKTIEIMEATKEMMAAMSKSKFYKASKIVNASRHSDVANYYFESMDHLINQCENDYYDEPELALMFLQEVYACAITVDSDHPVSKRMNYLREKWMRSR